MVLDVDRKLDSPPRGDGRTMPPTRIKGVALRSFLQTLEVLHGASIVERTLEGVDQDLREALLHNGVASGGWYPLDWHQQLHVEAQRSTGQGLALSRRIGYEGVRADLRGVYGFLAKLLAPEILLERGTHLWRRYYEAGDVRVLALAPLAAQIEFRGCHGFGPVQWENVLGGMLAVAEGSRIGNARGQILRFEGGDADMRVFFTR